MLIIFFIIYRYIHHLQTVTKTPFTVWEEFHLFTLQAHIGNKWCDIAQQLPGRTESSVKNRWYSAMRRVQRVANCSPEAATLIIGQYSILAAKTPPLGYNEWVAWAQDVLSGKLSAIEDPFIYRNNGSNDNDTNIQDNSSSSTTQTLHNQQHQQDDTSTNTTTDDVYNLSSENIANELFFNGGRRTSTLNNNVQPRKSQFEDALILRLETYVGNGRPLKDFFDDPRYSSLMKLEAETGHLDTDPVHRRARRRKLRTTSLLNNDLDNTSDTDDLLSINEERQQQQQQQQQQEETNFDDSNISEHPSSSTTTGNVKSSSLEDNYQPTEFRSKRGRRTKPKVNDDYVYNADEIFDDSYSSGSSSRYHNYPPSKSMFYEEPSVSDSNLSPNIPSSSSYTAATSSSSVSSSAHRIIQQMIP